MPEANPQGGGNEAPNIRNFPNSAMLLLQGTERRMKMYALAESELDLISFMNTLTAVCFSVGSVFLGAAFSKWIDILLSAQKSVDDLAANRVDFVLRGVAILGVILYGIGAVIWFRRRDRLNDLKSKALVTN